MRRLYFILADVSLREFGLDQDNEANRLSARATRYARLGVNAGALAARVGVNRLRGGGARDGREGARFRFGLDEGPADEGGADADHHS